MIKKLSLQIKQPVPLYLSSRAKQPVPAKQGMAISLFLNQKQSKFTAHPFCKPKRVVVFQRKSGVTESD